MLDLYQNALLAQGTRGTCEAAIVALTVRGLVRIGPLDGRDAGP